MSSSHRRTAGIVGFTLGALLASPVIALLTGPLARADDLVTIGPYTTDGYTDTLTYDTDTSAFDNLVTGSYDSYPYDLDIYSGAPGSGDSEVLFTIPLLFQGGFEDVDGTITPISSFDAADFVQFRHRPGRPRWRNCARRGCRDHWAVHAGRRHGYVAASTQTHLRSTTSSPGPTLRRRFDLDIYSGAPGSDTSELLFTVPSLFQFGVDDVAGTLTPLYSFDPADFISPDIGLGSI